MEVPKMELQMGIGAGLGITVDETGEVVILVIVWTTDVQYCGVMSPEVALSYGRAVREMSRDANKLQDEIDDLDPEEVQDRLVAIRKRFEHPS